MLAEDSWDLVVGAGYVGTQLALQLAARGRNVLALRRSPPATGHARVGHEPRFVAADVTSHASLRGAIGDRHVARIAYLVGADARTEVAYRRAYVDGIATLCEVLRERGDLPRKLVFASSTAVYGDVDGSFVDEDTPPQPEGFTGAILLEGEAQALAFASDTPTASTVIRFAGIYGPGRTRLIDEVRSGRATLDADPAYTNRIHQCDCAGLIAHVFEHPSPPRVLIGVDDDPADRADVLRFLAERLGQKPPPIDATRTRTRSHKRCRSIHRAQLGYELAFPSYREGYGAMLTR